MEKHPVEAKDSWSLYLKRQAGSDEDDVNHVERQLKHHHHHHGLTPEELEEKKKEEFDEKAAEKEKEAEKKRKKEIKKRRKKAKKLITHSGIGKKTVHGMMIDAGSTGTRMHVYEFDARVINSKKDVQAALSGKKISFPKSDSRWTDRLRPGLSSFSDTPDDELVQAIADYLDPLLNFARAVLHTKKDEFAYFPIYLKATGGMRILTPLDRARVMGAVRELFNNKTYCPFWFEDERARVISGEEEAIFDWANVNFLMGTLIEDSEGAGTVLNPLRTYGALDMGGASTQISFYEPENDIMANLFKLQIGQGRHWNIYAHSFLHYGLDRATNRLEARLAWGKSAQERIVEGVYNPCLPGGAKKEVRTNLYIDDNGVETWDVKPFPNSTASDDGYYAVMLKNDNEGGDFDLCMEVAFKLLHKEQNEWCNFSHRGHCSYAGIFQPDLPTQSAQFGEFIAFSNFFHTWDFLQLESRSSMDELKEAARHVCSMSEEELHEFNAGRVDDEEANGYCFNAAFAYQVLRNGYGFADDYHVTALNVINNLKVGWALGSMLYEINTLPWDYKKFHRNRYLPALLVEDAPDLLNAVVVTSLVVIAISSLFFVFQRRGRRDRSQYEPIRDLRV